MRRKAGRHGEGRGGQVGGGGPGLCLKGRGCDWGKFQSGCGAVTGDVKRLGGRLLAVGNAVGAGVGVWECLWGRVRAGVLGGRGVPPPPPLKRDTMASCQNPPLKRFPGVGAPAPGNEYQPSNASELVRCYDGMPHGARWRR